MRSLTLFKSLVSGYRKTPVSIGQIRHYGRADAARRREEAFESLLVNWTILGLTIGALCISTGSKEGQNETSSDSNTSALKQEQEQEKVALMLALKAMQEEHPEYSIKLKDETPDNTPEASGPKLP